MIFGLVQRDFFKYFFNKDMLKANIASKVKSPKLHEKPIIRLEPQETAELLYSCETLNGFSEHQKKYNDKYKIRDNAIISLFLTTGIRVSECVGLDIDDIDFSVNGLRIIRKGGNSVIIYFSDEIARILKKYLEDRKAIKGLPDTEKALFLSLQKKRISTRAVQNLVKKYSSLATPLKNISPHKLRSTYGTNLYHETKDIYVVADVLGHKDINTTKQYYAAMSDDVRRNAARKVKLKEE